MSIIYSLILVYGKDALEVVNAAIIILLAQLMFPFFKNYSSSMCNVSLVYVISVIRQTLLLIYKF